MAPHLLPLLIGCSTAAPAPGPDRRPDDAPPWGTAPYLPYARLDAPGERVIAIDVPGGTVDRLLADGDVTTVLTDKFATIFLHPRARPELTRRLGFPSVTAVDADGCVRARVVAPRSPGDVLATLNAALRARKDGTRSALPPIGPPVESPDSGGTWTVDHPEAARPFVDPVKGAPAVIWQGRPYIWGNREDALAVAPDADAFLTSGVTGPPRLDCPLR